MKMRAASGLKATLRRILRQPDLAGLSHANSRSKASKRNEIPEVASVNRGKRQVGGLTITLQGYARIDNLGS